MPGLGQVEVIDCKLKDSDVGYRAYELRKGRLFYAAEGLTGYDSALQLGLRSLVADQPAKGEISIATTGAGDPAAFARVQAGTLDPSRALAEAYRRNNSGNYAEAAEFFAAVSSSGDAPLSRAEGLANEALQKSNLGRYAEADSLFARAAEEVGSDAIVARRLRNYRAMHLLNQGDAKGAMEELDKPLPKAVLEDEGTVRSALEIDPVTARQLNADSKLGQQLGAQSDELLPAEKARNPRRSGAAIARHVAAPHRRSQFGRHCAAQRRRQARRRPRRQGRIDHVDARPDPRRPRRDR